MFDCRWEFERLLGSGNRHFLCGLFNVEKFLPGALLVDAKMRHGAFSGVAGQVVDPLEIDLSFGRVSPGNRRPHTVSLECRL